ncbi:DUF2867 domain-containing protein [Algoriphagus mannitolivorans]|uniref:DUF2867 domain-containing protein n=1 Tax=Algoriphagus mannitolivorans TaxID=226504 RepID=UPI0004168C68|nr:DUF2867 domain-containing protein [Algoriphagus mannitolivorans]
MKIKKTKLPENSILLQKGIKYDYIDSYEGFVRTSKDTISATEIGKAFFRSGPDWVEKLFSFRNKVVKLIGLKIPKGVQDKQSQLEKFNCEPGDRIGLFKVFEKTEHEVILGEDDKHLNFRVSLLIHTDGNDPMKKELAISTAVVFNNWMGKLYFLPVRPFHHLIVPTMLKGMIRELEKEAI